MGIETAILGAAALSAGSSAVASHEQRQATKSAKKGAKGVGADIRREIAPALALGEHYTGKAARAEQGGFDEAERNLARSEKEGLRMIGDERTRAAGQIEGGLVDRGLGSTTIRANQQQGLSSAYQRQLGDFQTRMGALSSEIARQRAQSKASGYGQLAQFQAYKAGALQNSYAAQANLASQPTNFVYQQPNLGGLGALAAMYGGGGGGQSAAQNNAIQQGFGAMNQQLVQNVQSGVGNFPAITF